MSDAPLLSALGLTKFFKVGGREGGLLHAVDHVDLSIGRGESIGLVGESGCGKSTLARVLAHLTPPSAGQLRFEGVDIGQIPERRFASRPERARIQMVFQDPTESLNPHLTVEGAILDPIRRLLPGMSAANAAARVDEVLDLVGLPLAFKPRYPHQLSGGQRARVGIARAIAVEPALLILDEPTSALDVSVQAVILKLLADLRTRLGMSYLFVSHDLNVVRLLCQRVVVMYLGKVIESGPVERIFAHPRHPYTRALLAAVPDPARRDTRPPRLAGSPSSPVNPDPRVCRFYGRCPIGTERCAEDMPNLRPIGAEHLVACHYAEQQKGLAA
ncbi:oligopeptide/dipeptide ABC transporter, ATP-binding protein, C-terminal domain-containing protein [Arboricoccus pini]|uniref:Oligopeptide/dipeptide ABC transporter, ATP-binding protein, C-terminal domain-containing protein n=1 Tax=Arboricoccus pini TaxID=1963835 RepID=A0A212RSE3_9PROT|nr:ABC transporter ATP-binding protein [Arboricoccus pini]SNB75403.1 oligopeptide/dipeptide ABC transporter, ATP-binding protein, C-terminal domain-containing protein [Arboricoccus pini]